MSFISNFSSFHNKRFIGFEIEAAEYSRCQFDKKNKVVELNDYEVLEIAKDKSQKYGYTYTVKKCVSAAFPRS